MNSSLARIKARVASLGSAITSSEDPFGIGCITNPKVISLTRNTSPKNLTHYALRITFHAVRSRPPTLPLAASPPTPPASPGRQAYPRPQTYPPPCKSRYALRLACATPCGPHSCPCRKRSEPERAGAPAGHSCPRRVYPGRVLP